MKCVIVCGGKGTRMGSIGEKIPKCLLNVGNKKLIEHQFDLLKKHGIRKIVLCTGYLAHEIQDFVGDGSRFGIDVQYSFETNELGTAGAIKNTEKFLFGEKSFLVLFGDIMIDMDITKLIDAHTKVKPIATVVVHKSDHPKDSTCVEMDENGYVTRMYRGAGNITKTSIHVLEASLLDIMPEGKSSLENDVLPQVLESGEKVFAYYTDEYVKDIGTPERLTEANARFS